MCGLAGFYNISKNRFTINNKLLTRMHERLAHRGPDSSSTWSNQEAGLGLSFARLQIQDLSSSGEQPMIDPDEQVVICFNGEIYNQQVIRKELKELGYTFTSSGDTQVILYAFKEWGIDCIYRLDGIFALVLYDFRRKELYLIRDRIGVKPLYFSLQGGILSFASEIKALWELPWIEKKYSSIAGYHYLTFMITPAPYTIYDGIYKVPAGTFITIDSQKRFFASEWYEPFTNLSASEKKEFEQEEFCVENIKALLVESTRKRMLSDVPVGAFLSGGIDSSLNVALMSRFSSNIKTFTVGFENLEEVNEFKWARLIAEQFNTNHHELIITEKDAFNFYEKMIYHLDEPLADCVCIPFYHVAHLARQHGVTVAQVGEGADELFVGYPVYTQYKKAHDILNSWFMKHIPTSLKKGLTSALKKISNRSSYVDLLHKWSHNQPLFWSGAIGFNEYQKELLIHQNTDSLTPTTHDSIIDQLCPGMQQEYDSGSIANHYFNKLKAYEPDCDFFQQMLYFELKHRLPELLLMRADKMSMTVGVEARVPFLDYKLVEFMMYVPDKIKFKKNTKKYLLKQVCQGILPDITLQRKKVGFAAPTINWFSSGSLFPAYFDSLAQQSQQFIPAFKNINSLKKSYPSAQAVQKWMLQNMWALK